MSGWTEGIAVGVDGGSFVSGTLSLASLSSWVDDCCGNIDFASICIIFGACSSIRLSDL